jgi:hypothetical protein
VTARFILADSAATASVLRVIPAVPAKAHYSPRGGGGLPAALDVGKSAYTISEPCRLLAVDRTWPSAEITVEKP